MKSIETLLQEGASRLKAVGIETPRLDAELLLQQAAGITRLDCYVRGKDEVSDTAQRAYYTLLARREAREPIAYLLGSKEFMGLSFKVTPDVLIPRPDTECLVEYALDTLLTNTDQLKVLDLCTGSGAIGLAIKHFCPQAVVTLSDISETALKVASANADRLGLEVTIVQSDLFEMTEGPYDCIITNPPYIPDAMIEGLEPDVKDYEPRLALSGGNDGFNIYRKIAKAAKSHLKPGGTILLEIGNGQEHTLSQLLEAGGLTVTAFVKDLTGAVRGIAANFPK